MVVPEQGLKYSYSLSSSLSSMPRPEKVPGKCLLSEWINGSMLHLNGNKWFDNAVEVKINS